MEALRDLEVSRQLPARSIRLAHADGALVMRPTLMSDADAICSAVEASRRELRAYMPWAHVPTVLRDQVARLRSCEADYFAGRDMVMGLFGPNGAFLSMVGLHPRTPLNPAALEVGYWCDSRHAGKGWTTLAAPAALWSGFAATRTQP